MSTSLFQVAAIERMISVCNTSSATQGITPVAAKQSPVITPKGQRDTKDINTKRSDQDVLDGCMSLDDQGEDDTDRIKIIDGARAATRGAMFKRHEAFTRDYEAGVNSMMAALQAAAVSATTLGASSDTTDTTPSAHRGQQEQVGLNKGDAISTTVGSPRPLDPTSFEEGGASPAKSPGRIKTKQRTYTVSGGHRRWVSSRSPSPVRSGEMLPFPSPPPCDESSVTAVAQVDGRISKVCVPVYAVHFASPEPLYHTTTFR